jgi:redox-sensitive bicupin YhaK (pirin superfamily)
MLHGRMRHKDSRGGHGLIEGGGCQWMTAGRGIVQSEMPEQERGLMSGFQLWLNLPASEKMRAQEYQDLQAARLAHATLSPSGSQLTVVAGNVDGLQGPVAPRTTQPLLFHVELEDDRPLQVDVPSGHRAFVFVHQGDMDVGGTRVPQGTLAVLADGTRVTLRAPVQRSAALVAAARPLHEPIVQRGPFVMNTDAEIEQAMADYRNGVLDRG